MVALKCESCGFENATVLLTFTDLVEYKVCLRCAHDSGEAKREDHDSGEAKREDLMPVL